MAAKCRDTKAPARLWPSGLASPSTTLLGRPLLVRLIVTLRGRVHIVLLPPATMYQPTMTATVRSATAAARKPTGPSEPGLA